MATLQVKGMDDRLYKALAARAAADNRSISQEVVAMIKQFLAQPPADPRAATRGLVQLAGSWEDERSAERMAADLRKARRSGRRFREDRNVLD